MNLSSSLIKIKNRPLLILAIFLGLLLILTPVVFLIRPNEPEPENRSIEIKSEDGTSAIVFEQGLARIKKSNSEYEKYIDPEKLKFIFSRISGKQKAVVTLDAQDPLLEGLWEELTSTDVGGGSGESVSKYFNDVPTPTTTQGQGRSSGGSGSSAGSGGEDNGDGDGGSFGGTQNQPTPTNSPSGENCSFWRISWCMLFASPTPTTQVTPSPQVQYTPDCDLYGNIVNKRTVIDNTLCNTNPEP